MGDWDRQGSTIELIFCKFTEPGFPQLHCLSSSPSPQDITRTHTHTPPPPPPNPNSLSLSLSKTFTNRYAIGWYKKKWKQRQISETKTQRMFLSNLDWEFRNRRNEGGNGGIEWSEGDRIVDDGTANSYKEITRERDFYLTKRDLWERSLREREVGRCEKKRNNGNNKRSCFFLPHH